MSTNAPLPPNFRAPTWATGEFRRSILLFVMGFAVIGWLVFDVAPKFSQKPVRAQKVQGPDAYVPQAAAPGEARSVRYEGVLEKVKDGTSIDDQDQPYQYVVRALSRMDAAQMTKDAKAVDYQYFSKMPVEMRGETVKITGLFLQSNPIRVDA